MNVYVAVNVTRDHEERVVGAATGRDAALSLLEKERGEPLRHEGDGPGVLNHPAEGPPDVVGFVVGFDLGETPAEAALRAHDAARRHFASCTRGCGAKPFSGEVWFCAEHDRLKAEASRLASEALTGS